MRTLTLSLQVIGKSAEMHASKTSGVLQGLGVLCLEV